MTNWYLRVQRLLRAMRRKAADALFAIDEDPDADTTAIKTYLKADYDELWREWSGRFPAEGLANLGRHIHFGHKVDYFDILRIDLPELEQRADDHLRTMVAQPTQLGYEHLLHPAIAASSSALAASGQLREAVLNSISASPGTILMWTLGHGGPSRDLAGEAGQQHVAPCVKAGWVQRASNWKIGHR